MVTSQELQATLDKQQSDYLGRLQAGGQLPKVINDTVAATDNGQTAALRTQEGDLLKGYVAAGATNREKYKDVWDPFARDRLAAQQTAQDYQPINDIRKELAMRADALGVATNSAMSMYSADNQKAQAGIGFTQDAYNRAYQSEQAAQAKADRDRAFEYQKQQDAIQLAESRASRANTRQEKLLKEKEISADMVGKAVDVFKSIPSDNEADNSYKWENGKKIFTQTNDKQLSMKEAQTALNTLKGMYGDPTVAAQVFLRATQAGGYSEYNPEIGPKYSFAQLSV